MTDQTSGEIVRQLQRQAQSLVCMDGMSPVITIMGKAASLIEALSAEKAGAEKRANEQTELAAKSIRRLAEKTDPGEIGAFASRDHWKAKCLAAESERDEARKEVERLGAAEVEIRRNPDQSIDEIVIHGAMVHIEQMSNDGWWMGVDAPDKRHWGFWFGSKNRKSHVEFRHTELPDDPVG